MPEFSGQLTFIEPQTVAYIKYYRKQDSTARDIQIKKFDDNDLQFMLKARTAKWIGPPNNWRLKNYEIRTFDGLDETLFIDKKNHLDTTLNFTPEDFVEFVNQKEMMTTSELLDFIGNQKKRGAGNTKTYEVQLHKRTSEPISIIILTIIGMAISARKVRGGIGLHLAMGVALGATYIFLSKFSNTFATNESLPAFLGVWIPNIIFGGIAFYLVKNAQK